MSTPYLKALVKHLYNQPDQNALEHSLESLLTPKELVEISKRLQIFNLLEQGIPQRDIADRLGVGIATVTRGSRALQERENKE